MHVRVRMLTRRAAALVLAAGTLGLAPDDGATYDYTFTPPAPADGSPKILKIELNSDSLRAGGPIAIRVTTTPDVTEVVTGSGKRQGALVRVAPGIFSSRSTLPHVGGLLRLHVRIHFKATTADGRAAEADVPVVYK